MFLNFVITYYKFTAGIRENKTEAIIVWVMMMSCVFFQLSGMTLALFKTSEIGYLTMILGFLFSVLCGWSLQLVNKANEKLLRRIIDRVQSKNSDHPVRIDEGITRRAENETEREKGLEMILLMVFCSFCVFCPYMYLIAKPGITFDHPDLQVIPFFYSFWRTDNFLSYVAKSCFEGLISVLSITSYWNFTLFMTYAITNLETHAKEINFVLNEVIDKQVKRYMELARFHKIKGEECFIFGNASWSWKRKYQKSVDKEFLEVVDYHQYIHGYVADVTKFWKYPMTSIFAWYISSTVLFIMAFLHESDNYLFMVKVLSMAIQDTISFHLFCNTAEIIYQMNELIMDSFYNTAWYYLLPKSRRNLLITLTLCQRKYRMKGFGMYVMNLTIFISALKIVYSVMNIIRMIQNK